MVYVFFAEGFEEIEALTPVDILRRAGIEVQTVGVTGKTVTGAHGIEINCDISVLCAEVERLDAVVLPGGLPGADNLEQSPEVQAFIDYAVENSKLIAAICAAPAILGRKGILRGKNAVCFPGFENALIGANVLDCQAVRDGNIITARGAGAASDFAFEILAALTGNVDSATQLARAMKYKI